LKQAALGRLRVDLLGEPEEGGDAGAGAAVLRLEQTHHLHVRIHRLGDVFVRLSTDSVVPALAPRGETVGRHGGDRELAGGARGLGAAVVVQDRLSNLAVARGERVGVARAFGGAHISVDLVQHVGVEVATLHKRLLLSSVFLNADSGNSSRQVRSLESENAANDEHNQRNSAETTAVNHDQAPLLNLDNDAAKNAYEEANNSAEPQEGKANVLGKFEFRRGDIITEGPTLTLVNVNAGNDDQKTTNEH